MNASLNRFCLLAGMTIQFSLCAYNVEVNEKWPSPTPWIKDRFTDFLDVMPHHAKVVEVGVQGGAYAICIFRKTSPIELSLVDCWEYQDPNVYDDPEANVSNTEQHKLYLETQKRFEGIENVQILKMYSKDAANLFENESLDWVYIDANHAYESVKEKFGIVQAVNEFLNENNLYFSFLTTENNYDSWAVQKPLD